MKKGWCSLICGLILGLIISFFTLDYNGWKMHRMGENGEVISAINEIDFDLITNFFLIVLVSILVIYILLAVLGKIRKI
ncbi:hypothetical protein LIS77_03685 [Cytobacillus firmus]|uniref:hypothetical protein n=1 Tax=Cytobacillus firmus TaxID=1399 RepID=UPI002079C9BD|nr:hypothetical protein [Cytobacillus firmus]USK39643.1 hypothetical protein LIS77_03685 [Cytobacillus firmus]